MQALVDYFPHWHEPVSVHPVVADVLSLGPLDEGGASTLLRFVDAAPKDRRCTSTPGGRPRRSTRGFREQPVGAAEPFLNFGDFCGAGCATSATWGS